MGQKLCISHPELVGKYYEPAEEITGIPIRKLSWEGPAEALRDTSVTQPTIYMASLCTMAVLFEGGLQPWTVAGHSLGEYSALVAAGVLSWTDGLRLVQLRGQLMAAAGERAPGAMAAIIGLPLAAVERLCVQAAERTGQVVEVANDNGPRQVVVSGQSASVQVVMTLAIEAGAAKAVELDVGAPFHCALMGGAEEEFAAALAEVKFRDPRREIVSSVTAAPLRSGAEAARTLRRQLTARVRWTETVGRMSAEGVRAFVEVGPGKVLSGLSRQLVTQPVFCTAASPAECTQIISQLSTPVNSLLRGGRKCTAR